MLSTAGGLIFRKKLELLGFVLVMFEGVLSFLFLLSYYGLVFALERSMQLLLEFIFLLVLLVLLFSLFLFILLVMVVVLYRAIMDFLTFPRGDYTESLSWLADCRSSLMFFKEIVVGSPPSTSR